MLDKFVRNTVREVSIDYIQKVICDYFDIPIEIMKSKTENEKLFSADNSQCILQNSLLKIHLL